MRHATPVHTAEPVGPWNWEALPFHAGEVTVDQAHRYCRGIATGHYENFPIFLRLFSPEQQTALAAVYAFARTADDFADEPVFDAFADTALASWRTQLRDCYAGKTAHPVFIALRWAIERFPIRQEHLEALLDAFEQDRMKNRYASWAELHDYCTASAEPVGRIVLAVLGQATTENEERSDALCTALQLANFWQDISVDAKKGRIYIPARLMARHGVTDEDILSGRRLPGLAPLIDEITGYTARLFRQGRPLIGSLPMPGKAYIALTHFGGVAILSMARRYGPALVTERPRLALLPFIASYLRPFTAARRNA